MKVYVDELPMNCASCFCIDNELPFCYLTNEYVRDECDMFKERCPNCPLQSITDYTKQVRKEVVQELKEKIEKRNNGIRHSNHSEKYKDGYSGCCCDVEEILDQIQGETK